MNLLFYLFNSFYLQFFKNIYFKFLHPFFNIFLFLHDNNDVLFLSKEETPAGWNYFDAVEVSENYLTTSEVDEKCPAWA